MLGGFQSIFGRPTDSDGPARARAGRIAAALTLGLWIVVAALQARADDPGPERAPGLEARVSTSPDAQAAPATAGADPSRPMHVLDREPPLTRAAARHRIEAMSPTAWLAHYGAVTVERRD